MLEEVCSEQMGGGNSHGTANLSAGNGALESSALDTVGGVGRGDTSGTLGLEGGCRRDMISLRTTL